MMSPVTRISKPDEKAKKPSGVMACRIQLKERDTPLSYSIQVAMPGKNSKIARTKSCSTINGSRAP